MDKESKFTRDSDGNVAVRVVSGKEALPAVDPNWMFARDENGNIAVRVVGASGDPRNQGYYTTPEALREAIPTGEPGDWAIVGTTDTVWVWDEEGADWVDTDQKGQVTSVNGKTGTVVLTPSDVGAATAAQGAKADTAIQSVKTINGQSIVGEGNVDVDALPDQTGQSGKFLTTDGTDASWSDKPLVNNASDLSSVAIKAVSTSGAEVIAIGNGATGLKYGVAIGVNAAVQGKNASLSSIAIGKGAESGTSNLGNSQGSIAIGYNAKANGIKEVSIGYQAVASNDNSIQIGTGTNTVANTFKVGNANGNFEMMSADGTIPEARLADTTNAQQGDVLTLDSNGDAVWQASSGGLPDQTGNTGKFLTTDGTDASWSDKPLVNNSSASYSLAIGTDSFAPSSYCTCIGYGAAGGNGVIEAVAVGASTQSFSQGVAVGYGSRSTTHGVSIGKSAQASMGGGVTSSDFAIAIGFQAVADGKGVIQLGRGTNNDVNTFKVANSNGNFEMMSADGTIPKERLANVVTTPSTMPELTVAGWSNNTQTVTVTGVTATNTVFVSPAPASAADYAAAGIICTAQAADSLTFTCTTVPTNAITVNVVIF